MEDKIVYVPVSVEDELPTFTPVLIDCGNGYFDSMYDNERPAFMTIHKHKLHSHNPKTWLKPTQLSSLLKETAIENLQNERKEWLINCLVECVKKLTIELNTKNK